jgi:hypothetical protein
MTPTEWETLMAKPYTLSVQSTMAAEARNVLRYVPHDKPLDTTALVESLWPEGSVTTEEGRRMRQRFFQRIIRNPRFLAAWRRRGEAREGTRFMFGKMIQPWLWSAPANAPVAAEPVAQVVISAPSPDPLPKSQTVGSGMVARADVESILRGAGIGLTVEQAIKQYGGGQ